MHGPENFSAKDSKLVERILVEEQATTTCSKTTYATASTKTKKKNKQQKFHQFVNKCVNNNNYSTILYTHTYIYI